MIEATRRHGPMGGRLPETISTGRVHNFGKAGRPYKHHHERGALTPHQADTLELLRVKPRTCEEVRLALNIEFSMARWALDCLANRSFVELYARNPEKWRAL